MLRLTLPICILLLGACAPMPPPGNDGVPVGGMCGGMTGSSCADPAAFCRYPESAQCGAADQTGTCRIPSDMCTMEYRPVCGCDGQTYSNACQATRNNASVAHRGECRPK